MHSETDREWFPVVIGKPADRALASVGRLLSEVRREFASDEVVTTDHMIGTILLDAYASRNGIAGTEEELNLGLAISRLFSRDGLGYHSSLYNGAPAKIWLLAHLSGVAKLGDAGKEALSRWASAQQLPSLQDLVSGLSGLAAVGRELSLAGIENDLAERCVTQLLADVSAGALWETPADQVPETRNANGAPYVDTGVAHGAAGIITTLVRNGRSNPAALDRALSATEALANLRRHTETPDQVALPIALQGNEPVYTQRCCWCYGDLGISASISLALGNLTPEWLLELREDAAKRLLDLTSESTRGHLNGAIICHGWAGILQMAVRVYASDGGHIWLELIESAFTHCLTSLDAYLNGKEPSSGTGLLEGELGVALAVLSAIGHVEPSWDRVLMLS